MSRQDPFDSSDVPELPKATKSNGMKMLTSCGCGCAVILLLLAIAAVMAFRHFMGPGDQVPTDHLLSPDAVFVAHMDSPSGDSGAREFLAELFHTLTTMDPEIMDEETRKVFEDLMSSSQDMSVEQAGQIVDFMPSSMTFVLEDNGAHLSGVFGLNLSAGPKLLRYLMTKTADGAEWSTQEWGDYEIFEPTLSIDEIDTVVPIVTSGREEPTQLGFFGFQHDTFVWSDEIETMQRALDRTAYEEEVGSPVDSDLRKDLETLRERWLVSTVLRDSPLLRLADFSASFLDGVFGEEGASPFISPEDLQWMSTPFGSSTTGIGFVGDDLVFRIEVKGLEEADVNRVSKGIETLLGRITDNLQSSNLRLAHEVIQGTNSLAVNANLEDLRMWMRAKFETQSKVNAVPLGAAPAVNSEAEGAAD